MQSAPDRKTLLNTIAENFAGYLQWGQRPVLKSEYHDNANKYLNRAETLIELLEVNDCGSVGGFDKNQQGVIGVQKNGEPKYADPYWSTLFGRFEWVARKNGFDLQEIKSYGGNFFDLKLSIAGK